VGYFPADDPKYSCIIVVSNPRGKKYYGSSVSGPVFKEIAEKIYATRLGVKDETGEYQADCNSFAAPSMVYFDDFLNYCNEENVSFVDNVEDNEWVSVKQTDDDVFVNAVDFEDKKVPDVKGMNITDAVFLLESMGLKVKFDGYGKVKSQSVKPGTELRKGGVINLALNGK
jgi:cell division protein FtsI (penicillin-binding protein 3)